MKTILAFFLSACLCVLAINSSQAGAKRISIGRNKTDGKVLVQQLCNSNAAKADIASLKKEVRALKKELSHRLDKIHRCRKDNKGDKNHNHRFTW